VVILAVGLVVEVTRGENAGRKLPQDFVVLEHLQLSSNDASWVTKLPQIHSPKDSRLAIAAWVSRSNKLEPLQAVGG
jgi:hypothetical protein